MKNPKVVISGYYGYDNCGDEAVLLAMIHCLRTLRPDARITVLSGNPSKTRELYKVEAVNRWNPISILLKLLSCCLLISGGGSLLQDVTSAKSPLYYLAIINAAMLFRKKVMIFCQGVGPLTSGKNRAKVTKAFDRCDAIAVRDENSAVLLKDLGVKRDIQIACDPVMVLSPDDVAGAEADDMLPDIGITDSAGENRKPLLMAAVRNWGDNRHIAPVAELLDTQAKRGWNILLVPAHYPDDIKALEKVTALMTERPYRPDKCLTAKQFMALTSRADKVLSMRLHGLICAFAAGTPMLGLSYDPKVDAFMAQAGLGHYCLPADSFDVDAAELLLEETGNLPITIRLALETRRGEMREQVWAAARKAAELLS